jgi:hypothetical protein
MISQNGSQNTNISTYKDPFEKARAAKSPKSPSLLILLSLKDYFILFNFK